MHLQKALRHGLFLPFHLSSLYRLQKRIVSTGLRPIANVPLFSGGVFNASYNDREPLSIATPPGLEKAVLSAVISGHGSDNNQCAEFCPTSHHFSVNGQVCCCGLHDFAI